MAGPAIAAMLYVSLSMTIDAPRHPHRRNTGNTVHRLHGTVTFLTREARLDVPLMCKVNKVGNIVNFYPRYRFAIFPVRGQLQDLRTLADTGNGVVTANAFTNTGYAGDRRLVSIDVTMLARNFVVRCMHRVTEFDWLDRRTIREILPVHKNAYQESKQGCHTHKEILLCGPERIENRD